jgi:outer membrane protein
MGVFDEQGPIQHSRSFMKLIRMLCAALISAGLTARAQDTNQQPVAPTAPAAAAQAQPDALAEARALTQDVGTVHKTRILTIDEVIRLTLQHNLDIQITRYTPAMDLFVLNGDYSAYDPSFGFTASHSFTASPAVDFNPSSGIGQPPSAVNEDRFEPSLSGTLPTGLQYSLSAPLSESTGSTIPTQQYDASAGATTLRQPILKNFWTDNNRFTIRIAKNLLQSDQLTLRLHIVTDITSAKTAYYNLIAARANVLVNVDALELAERLVAENQKRVQVGALAPLDEKQSESQAATTRANLLAAEQSLSTAENTLRSLIMDNYADWMDVTPVPSEALVAVPAELDLQESWRKGVTQRPEMLMAKLALAKQDITVKYNLNQVFPEVDLTGSYGHSAANTDFDQTLNTIQRGTYPSYSYGVSVTVPLGDIGPRNAYKAAKAAKAQALLQLKQEEQTIVIAIDNDVKTIRSDLQQVDATREARVYAEAALAAEQKKLLNGKSTSFIVLQLQSNLTTARSAEIAALANYNIAVEQLALDEGSTLDRNHINLEIK